MRFVAEGVEAPRRATDGSAGYDFYLPLDQLVIGVGETVKFGTGVRVEGIPKGVVLLLFARSSLGSKGLVLTNGTGVIDSDFTFEIKAFLTNYGSEPIKLNKGDRYMQGIFVNYRLTDDDVTSEKRIGGVGSTGK